MALRWTLKLLADAKSADWVVYYVLPVLRYLMELQPVCSSLHRELSPLTMTGYFPEEMTKEQWLKA